MAKTEICGSWYPAGSMVVGCGRVISCARRPTNDYEVVFDTTTIPAKLGTAGRDATIKWMREESGQSDYQKRDGYKLAAERWNS